jgi:biotin operon repressor
MTHALILLANGQLPLGELARRLGVSEVSVKRMIGKLRKAGEEIVSVRTGKGAYYELRDARGWEEVKRDPLLTTVVPVRQTRVPRRKPEDADYDRD